MIPNADRRMANTEAKQRQFPRRRQRTNVTQSVPSYFRFGLHRGLALPGSLVVYVVSRDRFARRLGLRGHVHHRRCGFALVRPLLPAQIETHQLPMSARRADASRFVVPALAGARPARGGALTILEASSTTCVLRAKARTTNLVFRAAAISALLALRPEVLQACSVCFGKSDGALAKGMNMGIFTLL